MKLKPLPPDRLERFMKYLKPVVHTGVEFMLFGAHQKCIRIAHNEGTKYLYHMFISLNGNSKQRRQQQRAAMRQVQGLIEHAKLVYAVQ